MTEAQQNEAAQLVIGMVITGLIVFGIVGSLVMKWFEDRAVDDMSTPADPAPIAIAPANAPAPRSEAVPATLGTPAPEVREPLQLTKEDVVRALAELEIIGPDGAAQPVSVKAIARFVGMRDADVSALVKEVRGGDKPAPPKPAQPFEELTKDGRPVAAHLMRTKARA